MDQLLTFIAQKKKIFEFKKPEGYKNVNSSSVKIFNQILIPQKTCVCS